MPTDSEKEAKAHDEQQAIADSYGVGYVIPWAQQNHSHTYAFGLKTKELVKAHYFCGGEADQHVFWTDDLQSIERSGWMQIQHYKWTPWIIGRDSDWPARVWQSVHPHVCTYQDWIPMPPQQLSVIQQIWAEVDAAFHKFNNDNTLTADQATHLKGYMRGLCTSIRVLMNPRFVNDDAVVEEVNKRHLMRLAETPYVTPGVGEPLDPARLMEKPKTNGYAATKIAEPVAPKHNLSPEVVEKIKSARTAGFPADDLCKLYGITKSVLDSL